MRPEKTLRELVGIIMVPSHELEELLLDAYADEIEKAVQTAISDQISEEVRDAGLYEITDQNILCSDHSEPFTWHAVVSYDEPLDPESESVNDFYMPTQEGDMAVEAAVRMVMGSRSIDAAVNYVQQEVGSQGFGQCNAVYGADVAVKIRNVLTGAQRLYVAM
jgi:hypothetical protein